MPDQGVPETIDEDDGRNGQACDMRRDADHLAVEEQGQPAEGVYAPFATEPTPKKAFVPKVSGLR
jgi:hypothetical protein